MTTFSRGIDALNASWLAMQSPPSWQGFSPNRCGITSFHSRDRWRDWLLCGRLSQSKPNSSLGWRYTGLRARLLMRLLALLTSFLAPADSPWALPALGCAPWCVRTTALSSQTPMYTTIRTCHSFWAIWACPRLRDGLRRLRAPNPSQSWGGHRAKDSRSLVIDVVQVTTHVRPGPIHETVLSSRSLMP